MEHNFTYITRQAQIVLKKNEKEVGFFSLFLNGRTGTLYSLIGDGILKPLVQEMPRVFEKYDLNEVHFVMEPRLIAVLHRLNPGQFQIFEKKEIIYAGKVMKEVVLMKESIGLNKC